jgi:glyoxylate carboligase
MPKMNSMEAAVRILESEGVKNIFGIPGAGILPFYRALMDLGTIKHMVTRHEESAIHMFTWRMVTPERSDQLVFVLPLQARGPVIL